MTIDPMQGDEEASSEPEQANGESPRYPTLSAITRRRILQMAGGATTGSVFGTGVAGATTQDGESRSGQGDQPPVDVPTSSELRETGDDQRRWLSLPESRLVANPTGQHTPDETLPLDVGYFVADTSHQLSALQATYRHASGSGSLDTLWRDTFDSGTVIETSDDAEYQAAADSFEDWVAEPTADGEIANGELKIAIPSGEPVFWGAITRWASIDFDANPYIRITIPESEGMWSLKVNDGTNHPDIPIQFDTSKTGTHLYNLQDIVNEELEARGRDPWTSTKDVQIHLFAVGYDAPVRVEELEVLSVEKALETANTESIDSTWTPHRTTFEGAYSDTTQVGGRDFFFDRNTVCRELEWEAVSDSESSAVLAGSIPGDVSWHGDENAVVIETEDYAYALAFSTVPADGPTFYETELEFLTLSGGSQTAGGGSAYWALEYEESELGPADRSSLRIAAGFAPTEQGGASTALERARRPLVGADWSDRLEQRHEEWTTYLESVPDPLNFELPEIENHGATADRIRHNYYAAWVFLRANILPPLPEVDYPYPQMPTGKPSLWTHGPPGAAATAPWEGFLGMQLYAYVDPQLSWRAFEGMMTRVTDSGKIEGESLPSRKAQTAWVLYQLTGDRESLAEIYAPLRRYLRWRKENPRWIFGGHDDPTEKDMEFVVHVLVDMDYAKQIARVLDRPAEVERWEQLQQDLFQKYLDWFWPDPTTTPPATYAYVTDSGIQREAFGRPSVVATGLHLNPWNEQPQLQSIKETFLDAYELAESLVGIKPPWNKYPDYSYAVYGLIERGMLDPADTMISVGARDVALANMFAEQYKIDSDLPRPDGVRPSLFGACMMIDMVWLKNDYRYDLGWPHFVQLAGGEGGILDLTVRGKTLNMELNQAEETIHLWGDLVNQRSSCRSLTAPIGETLRLPRECANGEVNQRHSNTS